MQDGAGGAQTVTPYGVIVAGLILVAVYTVAGGVMVVAAAAATPVVAATK